MKIALAQVNPTVGDLKGNAEIVREWTKKAAGEGADLVIFPELMLTGYPPRDLLENDGFIRRQLAVLEDLAKETTRPAVIVGFAGRNREETGKPLHNAAAFLCDGEIRAVCQKSLLPSYDVFDEDRYFEPGRSTVPTPFDGETLGISICEDMWSRTPVFTRMLYRRDPLEELTGEGADLLINISASPFELGKISSRLELIRGHARRQKRPIVFVNQVGGNDELLFDGSSAVFDAQGKLILLGKRFEEELLVWDTRKEYPEIPIRRRDRMESLSKGLETGIRDYLRKCGFQSACLGLSGGIDSAVVAVLAVRALGADRVTALLMPSRYTSGMSREDAETLAKRLGIRTHVLEIEPAFDAYLEILKKSFEGREPDITEENLQARIRGNLLMAFSNKFGHLLLSTGNKSEMAVGYCTLYGDMAGGLAVISDVPKTMVYDLARWYNRETEVIPKRIIDRPPSAELREDQEDQDSLPPYETLDPILKLYIEDHLDPDEIVRQGHDRETVLDVIRRVDRNEYKRRQAPPGLRVTSKAFGIGRQMPIAKKTGNE